MKLRTSVKLNLRVSARSWLWTATDSKLRKVSCCVRSSIHGGHCSQRQPSSEAPNLVDSKGHKADRVEKRKRQKARGGRKKKQPTHDEKEKGDNHRPPKTKTEEATKKEEESEERKKTRPPASLRKKRLTGKQANRQLCKIKMLRQRGHVIYQLAKASSSKLICQVATKVFDNKGVLYADVLKCMFEKGHTKKQLEIQKRLFEKNLGAGHESGPEAD